MNYYKARIQYAGSNYFGFQWQTEVPTVQQELNLALSELIPGKVTTVGASRTDSGVHAIEQIVKITSVSKIDCSLFIGLLNDRLPLDIRCTDVSECPCDFKPNLSLSKEYRYFFTNKRQVSKSDTQFIANFANSLDIPSMQVCIGALMGQHDFCNFYSSGSNVRSTLRKISVCELTKINPQDIFSAHGLFTIPEDLAECYQLKIEANGFLKQMIRHIMSALWMVGSGKLNIQDFIHLLDGPKTKKQLWKAAPSNGLYLYQIKYP